MQIIRMYFSLSRLNLADVTADNADDEPESADRIAVHFMHSAGRPLTAAEAGALAMLRSRGEEFCFRRICDFRPSGAAQTPAPLDALRVHRTRRCNMRVAVRTGRVSSLARTAAFGTVDQAPKLCDIHTLAMPL